MSTARKRELDPLKDEVIHIRTTLADKLLVEKAAESVGLSISSFILQNGIKAARRELAAVENFSLSKKEAKAFLSALLHPPAPNAALKAAFKDYEKQRRK